MGGAPRGPRCPAVPTDHPSQHSSPSPSAAPSLADARPTLAPHRRSSPTSADLLLRNLARRGGSAPPPPGPTLLCRRPPRSSAPHLPSSGSGSPALPGWPPAKCPPGPLGVGAPALNSATSGRCSPGPAPHCPEGPSPSAPYAAPLLEVLAGSPTCKVLHSPARFTSPHHTCYLLFPQIPPPGKFHPSSWGPRCQRWVSAGYPRPAPAATADLRPGWRAASHQNMTRRWASCSQV